MATSSSWNYKSNRDAVLTRALRILSAIGQGETPTSTQVTEAAEALNDIIKEIAVVHGMPLWTLTNYTLTPVANTSSYNVGTGLTINSSAPLFIVDAFYRNATSNTDTPLTPVTFLDWNKKSSKYQTAAPGTPVEILYQPPGNLGSGEFFGIFTLYPAPDATFVAANTAIYIAGYRTIQDVDAAVDDIDFPSYWTNALKWALADQLAYEYGVPLAERSMITKKAEKHLQNALNQGGELGSLLIQPAQR